MHTGDLAVIDAEGYLQHRRPHQGHGDPRRRERLSARDRGISLSPSQDPGRAGVRRADDRYGEELCAWIRIRSGETLTAEEIRAFCQGQIAHYKIPRYVKFVDEFPMTVTGKIQKFLMRDAVEEKLGLKAAKTA